MSTTTLEYKSGSNIYFTADTHFDHSNIIKYCRRPYKDVREMNDSLVDNWNKAVPKDAIVFHLGDLGWGRNPDRIKELIKKLNGLIILVPGNHDPDELQIPCVGRWGLKAIIPQCSNIKIEKQNIVLCHYAMRVWDQSHRGAWQLFGHTHAALPDTNILSIDVGVDAHGYKPVSYAELETIMVKKHAAITALGINPNDPYGIIAKDPWDKS
jgi:calcineurin-like phosphoesterase family protein